MTVIDRVQSILNRRIFQIAYRQESNQRTKRLTNRATIAIPARLSHIPAFSMSRTVSLPAAKTIALGGVPTGSMKSQAMAKVDATSNAFASMASSLALCARMGNSVSVTARLVVKN